MENSIEYKGYKISILPDTCAEDPRTAFDNQGTMACFAKRHTLGDSKKVHLIDSEDFNGWAEMRKYIEKELDAAVVLPIYMYSHGGETISTSPFSCPWDSGQIGFIFISKEKVREEYSVKRISKELLEKVTKILQSEVETYDQYITGDVYGYKIMNNQDEDEEIDSCWGFYGSEHEKSGLLEYAKNAIDCQIKEREDKELLDIDSVS